jgi:predicted nicotinamide N-methyase
VRVCDWAAQRRRRRRWAVEVLGCGATLEEAEAHEAAAAAAAAEQEAGWRRPRVSLGVAGKVTMLLRVTGSSSVSAGADDDDDDDDGHADDDEDADSDDHCGGGTHEPAAAAGSAGAPQPGPQAIVVASRVVQLHVRVHRAVALARELVGVLSLPTRLLPPRLRGPTQPRPEEGSQHHQLAAAARVARMAAAVHAESCRVLVIRGDGGGAAAAADDNDDDDASPVDDDDGDDDDGDDDDDDDGGGGDTASASAATGVPASNTGGSHGKPLRRGQRRRGQRRRGRRHLQVANGAGGATTWRLLAAESGAHLGIGGKLWDSSWHLAAFLAEDWCRRRRTHRHHGDGDDDGATAGGGFVSPPDQDDQPLIEGRRVLELGSGTGVLGSLCVQLGAAAVTVSDLPAVVPLLDLNLLLNSASASASASSGTAAAAAAAPGVRGAERPGAGACCTPVALALPWGTPLSALAREAIGGTPCDCLLLCDVVYEPTLFPLLLRTLAELCGADTLVLMAYRRRNPDE